MSTCSLCSRFGSKLGLQLGTPAGYLVILSVLLLTFRAAVDCMALPTFCPLQLLLHVVSSTH